MLIPQLYGPPFAGALNRELATADRVDIATAWVRASGVGLLWTALADLLARDGVLRVVVGIDRDNTSLEGLELLLKLEGNVKVWVRHNEAGPIFHPKLYAFRKAGECKVFVGSNNLTGAGLSSNEELSASIVEPRGGGLEQSLSDYLKQLRHRDDPLVKRLDHDLLKRLLAADYIHSESRLNAKAANDRKGRRGTVSIFGSKAGRRQRLPKTLPLKVELEAKPTVPSADWNRVFIKLRLARGTQGQIPLPVAREIRRRLGETQVDGPFSVIDRRTRTVRQISPTFPKRKPDVANTYKVEAFDAKADAILKLEFVGNKVLAEIADSAHADGKAMYDFIIDGLLSDPIRTVSSGKIPEGLSKSEIETQSASMTLYRFD